MDRLAASASAVASSTALVVTASALATATVYALAKAALWPRHAKVLPGPLKTAAVQGSGNGARDLVYQPDHFPGARDVATPYGCIRVYEFGPEDGRKVLLVHGISTSCVTLDPLATALAGRGCRVMLFDLFGRGFSDGVGDLPHDDRLYITQILLALASSPLSWTGNNAFSLFGYSMGGAIAVSFATAFPHLVSFLVLLAPAGLIRPDKFGTLTRFVFSSGLIPERLLAFLTGRRLQKPISPAAKRPETVSRAAVRSDPRLETAAAEAADPLPGHQATRLEDHVLSYVRWMVVNHAGFVPAFMSSIRFAPLTEQHASWNLLAKRDPGTTAIFFARDDDVIDEAAYREDAGPLTAGEGKVAWRVLPGGHDFVMTHCDEVLKELDSCFGHL